MMNETNKDNEKTKGSKDEVKKKSSKEKINGSKKDKVDNETKRDEKLYETRRNEVKKEITGTKPKTDSSNGSKKDRIKIDKDRKSSMTQEETRDGIKIKTKKSEVKPETKKEKVSTGKKHKMKKDEMKNDSSGDKDKKKVTKEKLKMEEEKDKLNSAKVNELKIDEAKPEISKERLTKLTDPQRESIIRHHRKVISDLRACFSEKKNRVKFTFTEPGKLKQRGPPQLAEVKSITFQEMDPSKDHIYEGYELKCVIIDEPTLGFAGVKIVIEDENGDVQRACIYNIEQDDEVRNKLGYGCRITILNPYFRIPIDQKQIIRVDDISSVIFDAGPDLSRCRYCGKTGSFMKCGNCKKACYCSKECQTRDWINLRHKFICTGL